MKKKYTIEEKLMRKQALLFKRKQNSKHLREQIIANGDYMDLKYIKMDNI